MKNLNRTKTLILISTGIFIIAIAQIANRYLNIPENYDFTIGILQGLGLGLILSALIKGKFKKQASN